MSRLGILCAEEDPTVRSLCRGTGLLGIESRVYTPSTFNAEALRTDGITALAVYGARPSDESLARAACRHSPVPVAYVAPYRVRQPIAGVKVIDDIMTVLTEIANFVQAAEQKGTNEVKG